MPTTAGNDQFRHGSLGAARAKHKASSRRRAANKHPGTQPLRRLSRATSLRDVPMPRRRAPYRRADACSRSPSAAPAGSGPLPVVLPRARLRSPSHSRPLRTPASNAKTSSARSATWRRARARSSTTRRRACPRCDGGDCRLNGVACGGQPQHGQTRFGRYQPESGPVLLTASFVDPLVKSRCGAAALRSNISVSASFVWRCLSVSTMTSFPHPAHRTGHADFPHPALGQELHAFAHDTSRPSALRRTSPKCS